MRQTNHFLSNETERCGSFCMRLFGNTCPIIFMTAEEVLEVLAKEIPFFRKIERKYSCAGWIYRFSRQCSIPFIRELLQVCEHVTVTVTMDVREQLLAKGKPHELFYMSHKMIRSLSEFTRDMKEPIWVKAGAESRFAKAPALNFLEQNLFRYHRGAYNEEQKEVQIFQAGNPEREMEETARRISRLVREHGYRYGQIAVITGNLEEYGSIARHVFDAAEIPFFVDEKHSVLMNPFVEYLRAALEMTVQGFSYESVFRYLRCGMSRFFKEEKWISWKIM